MHRRQYISGSRRDGFYEVLKWRSHAAKFAQWQAAQLRDLMTVAVVSRRGTTSREKACATLRAIAVNRGFFFRIKVWSTIFFARLVRWARGGYRSYQPRRVGASAA